VGENTDEAPDLLCGPGRVMSDLSIHQRPFSCLSGPRSGPTATKSPSLASVVS
jgi:hypothetical protein